MMTLKNQILDYTTMPQAQNQVLHLDGENDGSRLIYQHFKDLTQHLKQDRFEYDYGGTLGLKPKKVKLKRSHISKPRVAKKPHQPSHQVTHINWHHWRVFYYVVKAGGFLKAESYLRISQSSISRSIQTIEKILGQQLLVRRIPNTDTIMSLTPVGAEILAQISQGVEIFETLDAYVQQHHQKKKD